eukprot:368404_1
MQCSIVVSLPCPTQTHHVQEEPTHSIAQKSNSWSNSSHASKRNEFQHTPISDNTHDMCRDNAPKHTNTQHHSARVNMKHNQYDETDSIGTDHIAHEVTTSAAYCTQPL